MTFFIETAQNMLWAIWLILKGDRSANDYIGIEKAHIYLSFVMLGVYLVLVTPATYFEYLYDAKTLSSLNNTEPQSYILKSYINEIITAAVTISLLFTFKFFALIGVSPWRFIISGNWSSLLFAPIMYLFALALWYPDVLVEDYPFIALAIMTIIVIAVLYIFFQAVRITLDTNTLYALLIGIPFLVVSILISAFIIEQLNFGTTVLSGPVIFTQ